ncbi:MAG: 1-acyl-sn-glycerol-3-phosphate acyltransferase [Candidatus Velthaea sp.]
MPRAKRVVVVGAGFAGTFSVDVASRRAALPAIAYAAEEARSGAAVWIFPEGVLQPPSAPLAFTSGFAHAARRARVPIVPVAMRFVLLDTQRPHAFVAAGRVIEPGGGARRETEDAVGSMLAAIDADITERRIATHFDRVVRGARGVDQRAASALRRFRR